MKQEATNHPNPMGGGRGAAEKGGWKEMSHNLTDKQCKSTVWITPPHILLAVRKAFGGVIGLDPATEKNNPTKAKLFWYPPKHNALVKKWRSEFGIFVNPPYGRELMTWVSKICHESKSGVPIIALLPGQRFETAMWQETLLPCKQLDHIVFIRSRVKFYRPDGAPTKSNPYGSMLYVFNAEHIFMDPLALLGYTIEVCNGTGRGHRLPSRHAT